MNKDLDWTHAYAVMENAYLEKAYIQVSTIDIIDLIKYLQNPALVTKTQ